MPLNLLYLCIISIMVACNNPSKKKTDIQGHRGARGLVPENSIPSFKKALDLGVKTLELDVVISKDLKVVISHEPYMSVAICLDPQGNDIDPILEKKYNIFEMNYEQVKIFDCGSKGNVRFPHQISQPVHKPLLSEMIEEIEKYVESNNYSKPHYNIEIKSEPENDGKFHPVPEEFSDLVYEVIHQMIPKERVNIQSFDKRVLKYWRQAYPDFELAYLVEEAIVPEEMENILGFLADIYSPDYQTLTEDLVKQYHDVNVQVIPWTINELEDMKRIKSWDVDGIITDYPDRGMEILNEVNE